MNSNKYINYLYIVLVILWEPIQKTFLHIDGQGRIVFVLTVLFFLKNCLNPQYRAIAFSKPAVIWLIWVVYAFINMLIKGYNSAIPAYMYVVLQLFKPYFLMTVVVVECVNDKIRTIQLLWITYLVYVIIGFFFMDLVRTDATDYSAMAERSSLNTLGNLLPLHCVFLTFFALVLSQDKATSFSPLFMYISVCFSAYVIMVVATRKAFMALLIVILFYVLSRVKLTMKNILLIFFFALITPLIVDAVVEQSFIGKRFKEGQEVGVKKNTTEIQWLSVFGDRTPQYINGMGLFIQNPLTGIGLENYMSRTGTSQRLHTEYIVQLAENGVVGFILFLAFWSFFIKQILRHFRVSEVRAYALVNGGAIVAILFIGLTAWLYSMTYYSACLGYVLAFSSEEFLETIKQEQYEDSNTSS